MVIVVKNLRSRSQPQYSPELLSRLTDGFREILNQPGVDNRFISDCVTVLMEYVAATGQKQTQRVPRPPFRSCLSGAAVNISYSNPSCEPTFGTPKQAGCLNAARQFQFPETSIVQFTPGQDPPMTRTSGKLS